MPRRRWSRRRRRRYARRLVIVVVLAWLVGGVVALVLAVGEAQSGRRDLQALENDFELSAIRDPDSFEELGSAADHLSRASSLLNSPFVTPLEYFPVFGRQIRSMGALVDSAQSGAEVGSETLDEVRELLDGGFPAGPERVAKLRDLGRLLGRKAGQVGSIDLGPEENLVGPLATARNEADTQLIAIRNQLDRSEMVAVSLQNLLAGPSRYVVVAANNAEMRAGSGMFLQAGLLTAENGNFELGQMNPTGELRAAEGAVDLDEDYEEQWGFLEPNEEWRNLAASPRFGASAQLAAAMFESLGNDPVDGVLSVDPFALRALLRATGPVTVDGAVVRAEDVVDDLLHDQYTGIRSYLPDEAAVGRRDRLADIAEAALDALGQGEIDIYTLLEELQPVVAQRHLMIWSKRAFEQVSWEQGGAAGELGPNSLLVSVLNRGGNKLDFFLDVDADLRLEPARQGRTAARLRIRLTNNTPPGESLYIQGPFPGLDLQPGDYQGIVTANLPGTALRGRIAGVEGLTVVGADGPTRVVGTQLTVPAGESVEIEVLFALPVSQTRIRIEPDARYKPVNFTVGGQTYEDGQAHTVILDPAAP